MNSQNADEIERAYKKRLPILTKVRDRIDSIINEMLKDVPRIDRISTRVKETKKFVSKALKTDKNGNRKYEYPLEDIQDQIGCRIVVLYMSDVGPVAELILKEFREI